MFKYFQGFQGINSFLSIGFSISSTKTLFVLECYGGSKYTMAGVQISESGFFIFDKGHTSDAVESVFEYTYLLFWNSFWTIAPVIGIGLFDRLVGMFNINHLLQCPKANRVYRCTRPDGPSGTVPLWTRRTVVRDQIIYYLHV